MNPDLTEHCLAELAKIEAAGLLRRLQVAERHEASTIRMGGRDFLNFSSNDYLGLSSHPSVKRAFQGETEGAAGATASRLISGNHAGYQALEKELADFKRAESALVFTSGYAAAMGTIPALVGKGDFVVMDKLCHACLVDGARLSGATVRVFPHNHLKRCDELLGRCAAQAVPGAKVLLVTESVFSMDGDLAPLADLAELKRRHGAWLMVDEAHATGVLGTSGRGGAEHFGVEGEVDVSMGTLSKALGCVGGFICGARALRDLLVNRARSLIYSTGLPYGACRAAAEAVRLARDDASFRERLWRNVKWMEERLGRSLPSPIIPMMVGEERRCGEVAARLREQGIFVPSVRYPTVPRGRARLRVSVTASHVDHDLKRLMDALRREFGPVAV